MTAAAGGRPQSVFLLHGVGAGAWIMRPVARALRAVGYDAVSLGYPSTRRPLERIVATLADRIARHGAHGRIHLVGHSMGALVAQALVGLLGIAAIDRVVMLAPPHGGSEWVDYIRRRRLGWLALGHAAGLLAPRRSAEAAALLGEVTFPLGIIAGDRPLPTLHRSVMTAPHDGRVSVAATHVAGEADHIVFPVQHTLMLWNRDVQHQVIAFLRDGRFDRTAAPRISDPS